MIFSLADVEQGAPKQTRLIGVRSETFEALPFFLEGGQTDRRLAVLLVIVCFLYTACMAGLYQ